MPNDYIHHGIMCSYYSAKTRAYMSYKRIPFVEQYDVPDFNRRIVPITHKAMIPVVETPDGEILQDSTVIIDELERRFPERPVMPTDGVLRLIGRIVEFITDEFWISSSMHSRWNDPVSRAFIIDEFSREMGAKVRPDAPHLIGEKIAGKMQSYLPLLGIDKATERRAIDEHFQQSALALDRHLAAHEFAFGPRPSHIDFCLFTAFYAHHYRDPGADQTFLKVQTPRLSRYLDRLHAAHCCPSEGTLELTETFLQFLEVFCPPAGDFAVHIWRATQEILLDTASGERVETVIGPFTLEVQGHPFVRGGTTFYAWKAQRVLDAFAGLDAAARASMEQLAQRIGWLDVLKLEPSRRLDRQDYQVVAA